MDYGKIANEGGTRKFTGNGGGSWDCSSLGSDNVQLSNLEERDLAPAGFGTVLPGKHCSSNLEIGGRS